MLFSSNVRTMQWEIVLGVGLTPVPQLPLFISV